MKIKNLLVLIVFFVYLEPSVYSQCVQTAWEDNFDGTSLNTGLWNYDLGDGSGTPAGAGWGNAELQSYTNSVNNIKVENGNLVITALYSGNTYSSAKIKTTAAVNGFIKYGRIEARMKLPSATGVWPAFWMLPKSGSWPDAGEIDILEASHKNPSKTQSTVHYAYPAGTHQYTTGLLNTPDLSADFHVYAMEWSENEIRFYFDDQLYLTVSPEVTAGNAWPFNGEFYIMLNVAVGGPNTPFTGHISPVSSEYPTSLTVDYVKVMSGPLSTSIIGDNKVYQNSIKTYSIVSVADASYVWTVPQGATIQSGQGTSSISVQFANALIGNVTCSLTNSCGTNLYKKSVTVEQPFLVKEIYEDFETNRNISYGTPTGTLQQAIDNPAPGGSNSSTKTGRYVRNVTELYDVIPLKIAGVDQAGLYATQQRRIHLDVNSNAPVGTLVRIQFESSAVSTPINYPYGRYSVYDAYTTKQNEWETIQFSFAATIDVGTADVSVDQFVILLDVGKNTGNTYYIDNIRSGTSGTAEVSWVPDLVYENFDGTSLLSYAKSDGTYEGKVYFRSLLLYGSLHAGSGI